MLPMLRRRQEASVSVPSEVVMREPDDESSYDPLLSCAEDLLSAINSKDIKSIAEALSSAFVILESQPDEENESGEEE